VPEAARVEESAVVESSAAVMGVGLMVAQTEMVTPAALARTAL